MALVLYARQWCVHPDDALQDALIDLAQLASDPRDPLAWLFMTVRRKAINQARSENRRSKYQQLAAEQREPWFTGDPASSMGSSELESLLAGTIASSWICGAVVGAVCVFFFMSNPEQPMRDGDDSASGNFNQDSDHRLAETPLPIQNVVEMDSVEGQTSTDDGQMDLRSGIHVVDSTIRWRGHYVKTNELLSHRGSMRELGSTITVTADSTTDSDSFSNSLLSQFTPPQPVTQAELMRELLNPSKDTVH